MSSVVEQVQKSRALRWRAKLGLLRRCRLLAQPRPMLTEARLAAALDQRERERALWSATLRTRGPSATAAALQPSLATTDSVAARASAPVGPAVLGDMEPVRWQGGLGLNGMKSFRLEDSQALAARSLVGQRYGNARSQFGDARRLHVTQARQFGERDLLWGMLAGWDRDDDDDDDDDDRAVIPFDEADIERLIVEGPSPDGLSNVERFGELLRTAWRAGVKLRFTFFTLGGGSKNTVDELRTTPGQRVVNLVQQDWAPEYADVERAELLDAREGEARVLDSLDLGSPTKLYRIQLIAQACAKLLQLAIADAKSGLTSAERAAFYVDQVIDGIEIFNEAEVRNVYLDATGRPDPDQSGRAWAWAWAQAAFGFHIAFRELRRDDWVPPLYLPGLASYSKLDEPAGAYSDTLPGGSWDYKLAFLDAMLDQLRAIWKGLRLGWLPPPYDMPPINQVVAGVDYHWYHPWQRDDKEAVGCIHCGWLTTEVAALIALLESHDLDGRVTVYEDGTCALGDSPTDFKTYQVPPGGEPGDPMTDEERQAFQASDSFRRLLAALAGGAEQVGWHTWMSQSSNYLGFGLRRRPDEEDDSAALSKARPVWFAFYELARFFGAAGAVVSLVRPTTLPARTSLTLTAGAASDDVSGAGVFEDVLIFEITAPEFGVIRGRDLSLHGFAYVILVDPTATSRSDEEVRPRLVSSGEPQVVRLRPFATRPEDWELPAVPSPDADELLPRYRAAASISEPEDVVITGSTADRLIVLRGGEPLVLASKVRLAWD